MKFCLFVLPTVPGTMEDRERLRPIGRNNERFQAMIDEVRTLCVMADDFGFDCFSTTEHHFHSEGYEASVAPLHPLRRPGGADQEHQLRSAGVGAAGPRPVAGGRAGGLSRPPDEGPRLRRVRPGLPAAVGERAWAEGAGGGDADGRQRRRQAQPRVHEEYIDIIYKAWDEDLLTYDGEFYPGAVPVQRGHQRAGRSTDWTRQYGAPGEVDERGRAAGHLGHPPALPAAAPAGVPAVLGERVDDQSTPPSTASCR